MRARQQLNAVILMVDDDASVRLSTSRLLCAHGYAVFEVASAALALQRAVEVQPDVILMDLHMPQLSGINAAQEIKQLAELQRTPIIAISATPPDWVHESKLFATVLHKPYTSIELLAALAAAVQR
jgi:CheY-like chemotaxis protein